MPWSLELSGDTQLSRAVTAERDQQKDRSVSKDRKQQVPKVGKSGYKAAINSSTMTYILFGVAIVVIAAVVIGGIVWSNNDSGEKVDESRLTNTALVIGESAPSPSTCSRTSCARPAGSSKASQGQKVLDAVNAKLRVRYHMLNFLDRSSASGILHPRGRSLPVRRRRWRNRT